MSRAVRLRVTVVGCSPGSWRWRTNDLARDASANRKRPILTRAGLAVIAIVVTALATSCGGSGSGSGGGGGAKPIAGTCALNDSSKGAYVVIQGATAGQDCSDLGDQLGSGWTESNQGTLHLTGWNNACGYATGRQNLANVYFKEVGASGTDASGACGEMNNMGWPEQ